MDKDNEADTLIDQAEKLKANVRVKVERPFRVIKCQFGFIKVHYRGLKKNTEQRFTLFALSNLCMVRGKVRFEGSKTPIPTPAMNEISLFEKCSPATQCGVKY